jgi:hypothetical protein
LRSLIVVERFEVAAKNAGVLSSQPVTRGKDLKKMPPFSCDAGPTSDHRDLAQRPESR